MTDQEAYDLICREYLDKCQLYGCDGCIAECYCILKEIRGNGKCVDNLKEYLKQR